MISPFWKTKKLSQLTYEEWESLCDGCGLCCYRKYITGWLWWKKIHYTKIACDLLDLTTNRCSDYCNRFNCQSDCIKLDKSKVKHFKWLPKTCAYRLLAEGKELLPWHPLVAKSQDAIKNAGIQITDGIHERDAVNWEDYEIDFTK